MTSFFPTIFALLGRNFSKRTKWSTRSKSTQAYHMVSQVDITFVRRPYDDLALTMDWSHPRIRSLSTDWYTGFAVVGEYEDSKIQEAQRSAFDQMIGWLKSH